MTGLEIESWIEKRGRTVRKFRSTRPRTESNFRFGLNSCRSQNLPTVQYWSPVAPLSGIRQFFSRNLVKFTPCFTPSRIYPKSNKAIQLGRRWTSLLRQEIFGRYMAIISACMGKRCWPWDHQRSRTWQKESPGLAQFDKEHFFGTQGPRFSTARHQSSSAGHAIVWYNLLSYFCLLNVIFGCVSTEISIPFSTLSFPNRIEY